MSTNSECGFIEVKKGQWFYLLEDSNAPKNAWDWREYSRAYGPFVSEDAANQHLCENHANPGGSSTQPLPEGVEQLDLDADPVLKKLIEEAAQRKVVSRDRSYRFFSY